MQKQSAHRFETFPIGFQDETVDESGTAREIAAYLETDHTEMIVHSSDALDVIPNLLHFYDEPFADFSQIPTHIVSKLARQRVTVVLSGDGGDDIFGGYNNYLWIDRYRKPFKPMPFALRRGLGRLAGSSAVAAIADHLPSSSQSKYDKIHRMAGRLRHVRTEDVLYDSLTFQ